MAVVPSLIVLAATLTSMQLNDVLVRAESHARERPQQTLALYFAGISRPLKRPYSVITLARRAILSTVF